MNYTLKVGDEVEFWEITVKNGVKHRKKRKGKIVRLDTAWDFGFADVGEKRPMAFGFSQIVHHFNDDPSSLYGYRIESSKGNAWKLHFKRRSSALRYCHQNSIPESAVKKAEWDKEMAEESGSWKWED